MFEFEKLCRQIELMDHETFAQIITEKSVNIVKALSVITRNGIDGLTIYTHFILCSVAADGRLAEEEYLLLKPLFESLVGKEVGYQDAIAIFKAAGLDNPKEYKKVVDQMVDILGMLSLDLKKDIVIVCLMICAVDGKISFKEKRWVKQLIR